MHKSIVDYTHLKTSSTLHYSVNKSVTGIKYLAVSARFLQFLLIITITLLSVVHSKPCSAATDPIDIRVGSELEFPPYAFVDENGQAAGFSVDLIKAVTSAMGLSIKISTGTWDSVWNDLVAGRIDVLPIVAKLPERTAQVDFSLPHTETYDAFFVREGSKAIKNIDDASGKEIAVMRSDAAHHALQERDFQGHLVLVNTIPEGLSLIASGKHDAFLCPKLIGTLAIRTHGIKGLSAGPPISDYKRVFSFAVKKGDTELLEKLNQGLMIVKANGEYQRIYDKWLAIDDPWQKYRKYLMPFIWGVTAFALFGVFWLVMLQRLVSKRTRELTERNEMLTQIRDGLDKTVAERTAELSSLNAALISEIAERKRSESALREKEHLLSESQRIARIGGWAWDLKGLINWTDETYRIYGVSPETFAPTVESLVNLVHPEDRPAMQRWLEACAAGGRPGELEFRAISPDGYVRFLSGRGEFMYDAENKPAFMAGTVQDITERKQAEEALRESEQRLRLAVYGGSVGIWEWDIATNRLDWNDQLKEIFGLPVSTTGLTLEQFMSAIYHDDLADTEHSFRTKLEQHEEFRHEYRIVWPDGSVHWIVAIGRGFYDPEGLPVRMLGCALDITERRRAEEEKEKLQAQLLQAQKMEAVGHLAGGVAHDFNNILSAIVGYAHITLMKMKDDDPLRDNLEHILASSEKAANLTKSLLAFSRKQIMQMKTVNINDIVSGMVKMLDRIIGEDIYLQVNIAVHDLIVNMDINQIEQVIVNLTTNARDAMPGGGTITIATEEFEMDDKYIRIHHFGKTGKYAVLLVTDTGMGMDEKTRENIFDPFFTTKEVGKGTGLGLAMIYGTIKQHNGFINVYSEPEKGTTFKIYLPLAESTVNVMEKKGAGPVPSGTETVLLAEDDEKVRYVTRILLEEYGYSVIEAIDGKQAVELFRENRDRVHLVITDVIMPGQSGKDLHKELMKIASGIKIIFISGYPADVLAKKGIIDSEVNFISKPVKPEILLQKIREVLEK